MRANETGSHAGSAWSACDEGLDRKRCAQFPGDVGRGPALRAAAPGPPDGGDVPGAVGLIRQACTMHSHVWKPDVHIR